jgi:antitoxin ParD1/3/4
VSTTVEKVTLALTPALAAEVRAAVAGGGYASTSEVVRDALRLWRRRRALEALELAELRRAVEEADRSGPDLDAEAAFGELEARYAAGAGGAGDDGRR